MLCSRTVAAALSCFAAGVLLAACASNDYGDGVFSYAKDRCLGSYNQCRNDCLRASDPAVEAACFQRCYDAQNQCRAIGEDGKGSSLAQESSIGRARTQYEKEAAFRAYKARKVRERAEAAADGRDPYENSAVTEIIPAPSKKTAPGDDRPE